MGKKKKIALATFGLLLCQSALSITQVEAVEQAPPSNETSQSQVATTKVPITTQSETTRLAKSGTARADTVTWDFDQSSGLLTIKGGTIGAVNIADDYTGPWLGASGGPANSNDVKAIRFTGNVTANVSLDSCFASYQKVETIDFGDHFDTSKVENMQNMFGNCNKLTSLNFGNQFNTSSVKSMRNMFSECSVLTSLDVTNFDTQSVLDMSGMFSDCFKLASLDVTNFDTQSVLDMSEMFSDCSELTSLDLSKFDSRKVESMESMFDGCNKLASLNFGTRFITSSVKTMRMMFTDCNSLKTLDLTKFDTHNVTDMYGMFSDCDSLTSLDVTNFDTSKVTNMSNMFFRCKRLANLSVTGFDTSKVTDISNMFFNCNNLASLDVTNFDTSNVTNMGGMFSDCNSLTSLDVTNFDTQHVTYMSEMFSDCKSLTSLDVTNFDTSNVTKMEWMFFNCSGLTNLDLSNFDTRKVESMNGMFSSCKNLVNLNLGDQFATSQLGKFNMFSMFSDCLNLSRLHVGNGFEFKGDHDFTLNGKTWCANSPTGNSFTVVDDLVNYQNGNNNVSNTYFSNFLVMFDSQGGSEVAPAAVPIAGGNIIAGGKISAPTPPKKNGKFFTGWYTDPAGTTKFDFNTVIQNDTTLFAGWENGHRVRFEAGANGTLSGNTSVTVRNGAKLTELPTPIANQGFEFSHWEKDGQPVTDLANEVITSAATYKAIFKPIVKIHTVKLITDGNGELAGSTELKVVDGRRIAELPKTNGKPGYIFSRWVDEAGKTVSLSNIEITRDATYKAIFRKAGGEAEKTDPLYRVYNPNSGEHFYTLSADEKDHLVSVGWRYEGITGNQPEKSGEIVYRLYNANEGDHHYTTSSAERDHLVSVGWLAEGTAFHSGGAIGVYRLYNPNAKAGAHHYTPSALERDQLVDLGWQAEGIGWYGY